MRFLRRRYFEIDARTLGWLRIGLGLLLLFDLAKRLDGASIWYTNAGLLPNHRLLWLPASPYQLSYLFSLWTASQIEVAFAITAGIYAAFLLGHRTRLTHLLSWFCLLSLQTRTDMVANGGDIVFGTLMLWTAFLPLGRRYSLDALRAPAQPEKPTPIVSLAVLALLVQLTVIYAFNAVNKDGATWREGSAVHYLLHQARIVTVVGIWAREHLPVEVLRGLSYGTLVVESALPVLILCPVLGPWPRRLAIFLIWSLHGSIALLANLGVFSPVMMVFSLALLGPEDHDWLASRPWLSSRVARARAWLARTLERLRLHEPLAEPPRTRPLGRRVAAAMRWLREACLVGLVVCAFSQLVYDNDRLLGAISHKQPRVVRAIVGYLRLYQGWAMFAPDAPLQDMWIVIDAVTVRGRHIDPLNAQASLVANPALRTIPARLGQNVYFCDYIRRIPGDGHFHEPLRDWILEHHRRAKRRDERIERFDVYLLEHDSPPPGARTSAGTNPQATIILSGKRGE